MNITQQQGETKYLLKHVFCDIAEDSYEKGVVGEYQNILSERVGKYFDSPDELLKYIEDNYFANCYTNKKSCSTFSDGKIHYSAFVDEDGVEISENDMRVNLWKESRAKLWLADYEFHIEVIQTRTPNSEEISQLFDIEQT